MRTDEKNRENMQNGVDKMARKDHAFIDQTRPDQTRPDQTRPDQTRPDQTRPDQRAGSIMRFRMSAIAEKVKTFSIEPSEKRKLLCLALLAVFCVIQYVQLNLSCMSLADMVQIKWKSCLVACGTILLGNLFLVLITMRLHTACLIGSLLSLLLAAVNHYVYLYTGDLFSPAWFSSASTGLHVLGGYRFSLDATVLGLLLCFGAELCIAIGIKRAYPGKQKYEKKRFVFYLVSFLILLFLASGAQAYKYQQNHWIFNSKTYAGQHGYVTFLVQKTLRCLGTSVDFPQGYSQTKMEEIAGDLQAVPGRTETYPDIILILNETFYDLSIYTDLETDEPYLVNYNTLKNAIKGYALSPSSMGGTNDAEFELLTGHSSLLFHKRAPFTLPVSFDGVNSVARYLKALGYTAQAAHPCDELNYNRQTVYPELGFETARFYDEFTEHETYGNRIETDSANYEELIRWYEEAGDAPRFLYLLTYQNHGGYEQNDSELDTVHVKGDAGDVTEQVNEYLTSIKMSDEALGELLQYFDSIERPVIVCMVGDHSPGFLSQLREKDWMTETEKDILSREIPFLIWANAAFGEIPAEQDGILGMTDLMAQVFDTAGLPLSPYYNHLVELSRSVPVRVMGECYRAEDGADGVLEHLGESKEERIHLYLGYADLTDESGRWDFLFAPPG